MHILFLTDNFPPEVNAPASRTFEHAKEWIKLGHEVTVMTCVPNFPAGKVFNGYKNKLWQTEIMDGIRVIRVWSYITPNEGFWKRTLDYISYMISSFLASLFVRDVDVVVGTSPQFFTVVSAWAVAAVKRKPFVFELRDFWPDTIKAVGAVKNKRVLRCLEALELFLYRRARTIVVVTHSFKTNLIQRGVDANKIHVVTNGVDTLMFRPMGKDAELTTRLGLNNCFVVGYVGTHGLNQQLSTILDAAGRVQRSTHLQHIKFLFVGDGAEKPALVSEAETSGLGNIIFLGMVSKQDVARYWSLLDAAVVHLRDNPIYHSVIPSKIFECMASGVPILHGVPGESADIVTEANAGLLFDAENAEALVSRIEELVANPSLMQELKRNGPNAVSKFDRKMLAKEMLAALWLD